MQRPVTTIPIIGATTPEHIASAVPAVDITLSADDIRYLEEPYLPHPVVGANPPPVQGDYLLNLNW